MMRQALLAAIFLLALAGFLRAQVQVSAQFSKRSDFLLYERVDLFVTITNIGNTNLQLNNDEGQPWLSFMVSGESMQHVFLPVHSERESMFAPLTLKMGETKTLRVDLTPLFAFRQEGNYRASAVIDLPGEGQVVSEPIAFSVQRGHTLVDRVRMVDTLERDYSLVRFSPSADRTDLYLRVEAPSENLVYANVGLGELVSASDPIMEFDPQGDVHILQCTALSTYLYTRASADGKVLDQRLFKAIEWQPRPQLQKLEDGSVIVAGGMQQDTAPRERLSDSQHGERVDGPMAPGEPLTRPAPSPGPPMDAGPTPNPPATPVDTTSPTTPAPEPNSAPVGDPGMASKPAAAGP
jgi:hypothetical protein